MKGQQKQKSKQRHNKANGIKIPNQGFHSGGGNWSNYLMDSLSHNRLENFKVESNHEEYLIRHPKG